MPLAPLETCLYPESLLTAASEAGSSPEIVIPTTEETRSQWWVLHTRPRTEKTLARKLLARQIGFYLPLYEHRLPAAGRVRSSYLPLFPSYVFFFGDGEQRRQALETNLLVKTLPVADQPRLMSDLQAVRRVLESRQNVTPEERLQPGTPVRIVAGALAGLTGIVTRRGRQLHFVIEVRFFAQGVATEIESWMLEPTVALS
ncbi:MAG TPA: transcription termination/antitermination NusG family protein, partial [Gemmataceae bacterium]|nr:transcription termination/antitermination NusG family protein [Gemmataceae bacterium]